MPGVEMLCIGEKRAQRRAGPRRDDIERLKPDILDALIADAHRKAEPRGDFLQKSAFFSRRLEQRDLNALPQQLR